LAVKIVSIEEIFIFISRFSQIIIVSHKGHSINYHEDNAGDKTCYSLEDQIQHKVECLDTLIEENGPDTNFILVGHSIGSYISAEVLKKRPNHGISRVIALFPTLRDIAITPNGVNITVSSVMKDISGQCFNCLISIW
jgi:pimeloyl-ACP methyl ester carboxylesterase